ncbi:hypothetical protein DENSPDRAFT_866750 [Dentipellis sp. KUC8613]|nr:hypothetical protein DENSPDRAFT_866750 [Dentipellis sp. KUC8613]
MEENEPAKPLVSMKQEVDDGERQVGFDLDLQRSEAREPLDWDAMRARSLEPGGFGADRTWLWPKLLHADADDARGVVGVKVEDKEEEKEKDIEKEHEDERQIGLDTDRSFVLYPVEENPTDRTQRQHALHALIVQVFRRHPGLSYFQGYHDIITVLLLTLPEDVQLRSAERLSLQRLRDSMGRTLEPLVGLLRVLQRLLRVADPAYAALLEEQAPLPYPALSHLLTLFAHDVPTLPLAQHVFDYLFARPPIAVVYLAAAVMLARKDEVVRLEQEGEEGMIHSVLTGLPELFELEEGSLPSADEREHEPHKTEPEEDAGSAPAAAAAPDSEPKKQDAVNVKGEEEEAAFMSGVDEKLKLNLVEGATATVAQGDAGDDSVPSSGSTPLTPPLEEAESAPTVEQATTAPEGSSDPDDAPAPESEHSESGAADAPSADAREASPTNDTETNPDAQVPSSSSETPSPPDFGDPPVPPGLIHPHNIPLPPSRSPSRSTSLSHSRSRSSIAHARPRTPSPPPRSRPAHSLPLLLQHADALLARFPPAHPALQLDRTMGPASVVHTWSEDPAALPSDADAEALAVRGVDIVLPEPEPEPEHEHEVSASSASEFEEEDEKAWFGFGLRRRHVRDEKRGEKEKEKAGRRHRRKLRKHRRPVFGAPRVERRTMLAGAALVLGVAMAVSVYGMHARAGGGGSGGGGVERVGRLVGAVVELGGKFLDGFVL